MEKVEVPGASKDEIQKAAYKYAVKNAFEHKGDAQVGAVVGKVKALFPLVDLKGAMPIVQETVKEVNSLSAGKLEESYKMFEDAGWELKQVEKEKVLPELDWINKERLVTRVAPNPSGAMHFGHARPAILSDEYVKKYKGYFFLRFDDTDPKIKKPVEGIEKEFLEEFKWLGIKVNKTVNASDNLKKYYKVIERLLKDEHAYVCFCDSENWRKLIWKSKACPCREKNGKEQLIEWKRMLKHEIKEGEAVLRLKTDLDNKDPSIRDWWLARVVDIVEHPNKKAAKEHVWPSYNLASAVDDHDLGITFIIRGQEHIQNEAKQKYLYDYFGWTYPHTMYHGKVAQVGDMILSKSKIKDLMDKEGLKSDDDPRLATLKSFRRRGFKPEAIRKIILDMGLNPNESKIGIENFASANREFLGEVKIFPFFEDGAQIEVIDVGKGEANNYGEKIKFDSPIQELIVDKKELLKHKKGTKIRFKQGFNAVLEEIGEFGGKARFISYSKENNPVISWLKNTIDVEVLMSDGNTRAGITSQDMSMANGVVRLEGFGFVNIEKVEDGKIKCIFAHP
jgi:glutamyl-tRNA synthetase